MSANRLSSPRPKWLGALSIVAIAFGGLTVWQGGAVLFVNGEARRAAGDYVAFVLGFNFVAGFAYVVAGAGLWTRKRWAAPLALALAAATAVVFAALGIRILAGGAYEPRTVAAMTLRTAFWCATAWAARRLRPPEER